MAHIEQRQFCEKVKEKYPQFFKNKKVLDIGSLDINGTNKTLFDECDYIGLDVGEGNNVDVVCVGHLYDAPDDYFDTIISTETFEHDMFYEKTISNIMRMLKPGGLFLFTCAAPGRPIHGTQSKGEWCAPLLLEISKEWAEYYKNLTPDDFNSISKFKENFPDGYFEIKNTDIEIPSDLYFYGIKGGQKYITDDITPKFTKEQFIDDIFVIDSWPDTESKENDLINLIKRLKTYNIPILLSGHYPIKPEIQKMVDYYLYDKNNPVLYNHEFNEFGVNSARWTNMGSYMINNYYPYHHDYAIWEMMRNSFNFCKYLGKKYIHFMEYDNLPDEIQYRQSFLERIREFDAIIYEYDDGSTQIVGSQPYSSAYIFSIRTDVAINAIDTIKTRNEYFSNKPNGWQLEKTLLESIKKVTNNIHKTEYIANNNELNTQAVWARDGVNRNGGRFQVYLAVDEQNQLYVHLISGFYQKQAEKNYLIEINYEQHKAFHTLPIDAYITIPLGLYKKGSWVKVYYEGVEVYKEFLGTDADKCRQYNNIETHIEKKQPIDTNREIFVNFIDGAFVEIKEDITQNYHIEFINTKTGQIEFQINLESNHWAKSSKKYYVDWLIKIRGIDNDLYYEHRYNPEGKRVLMGFDSKSLGDTLAWIPYVDKFAKEHKCSVVCSTFMNDLFIKQYPHIEFVKPGSVIHNLYAGYRFGIYYSDEQPQNIDLSKNPTDARKEPLLKIASDILGLDYEEIKPKIPRYDVPKKKQVSIAIHSTAQCKYWNNPTGWQNVVDYLKGNGYEVILLSQEEDGYMGNFNPKGVKKHKQGPLTEIIKTIEESELFIGISGGLSWVAWATDTPVILISGFTDDDSEPKTGVCRIINKDVCFGCWSNHKFDPGKWDWCPKHWGTDRKFECSKSITSNMVINEIDNILNKK